MTPDDYSRLVEDLADEFADFLRVVEGLPTQAWDLDTPAVGWTVCDQVAHVAEFNDVAGQALSDRGEFEATRERFLSLGEDWVDELAWAHRRRDRVELTSWLVNSSQDIVDLLSRATADTRMAWFGPDMSAASCATARLMETWAHGQDVCDTVGVQRVPTTRLAHICHLGVLTRGFSFRVRGLEAPDRPVRVELASPDGSETTWGPADCPDRVVGTMQDFALVVTRRRHLDETALSHRGEAAAWLTVAQAYAGGPGGPRARMSELVLGQGPVDAR